jgi:formylglycine-generating enzyme required for sulfatase activity
LAAVAMTCGVVLIAAAGHPANFDNEGIPSVSPQELKPTWAKLLQPKPGTEFINGMPREILWLKDGAEMVLVPAGEFLFGKDNEAREQPAFYIDKFPVTNQRYKKFVDATAHRVPFMAEDWAKPYNWSRGSYPEGKANHPVVLVDSSDVVAYCRWAGKSFPSEEQWEKAARGTDGRKYPWGDELPEPSSATSVPPKRGLLGLVFRTLGWPVKDEICNSWHSGIRGTTAVDRYPRAVSPFGCYDMVGNVWEWTSTAKEPGWVVKGGSWFDGDVRVQSSAYGVVRPWLRGANLGFRCAVVLPE